MLWETDQSPPLIGGSHERVQWRLRRDWSEYAYTAWRPGGAWPILQETLVAGGRLETAVSEGNTQATSANDGT